MALVVYRIPLPLLVLLDTFKDSAFESQTSGGFGDFWDWVGFLGKRLVNVGGFWEIPIIDYIYYTYIIIYIYIYICVLFNGFFNVCVFV